MAVRSQSFAPIAGRWWISSPALINVQILGVKREGVGYDEKASLPTGSERKFFYSPSLGRIYFSEDQKFISPVNFIERFQVFALWKE